MKYLPSVINVFFMFAYTIPVHSNKAKAITAAFEQLVTTAKVRHQRRIQINKYKKFFNLNFQALMRRHVIQHFASESKQ